MFVASEQVAGRGRGINHWISQHGCLQFSLKISHQNVASLVFLQYLFGLSVVIAIKELAPSMDIHLKWPNDIYIKKADGALSKVGGILVTSESCDGKFSVTIGCGLNVSNPRPSSCLSQYTGEIFEVEMVLASILCSFQNLYTEMQGYEQSLDPFREFRARYYQYWLHTNQSVMVKKDDGTGIRVTIRGLDSTGFLKSKAEDGEIILLQPDGNTFDMIKGLITVKQ